MSKTPPVTAASMAAEMVLAHAHQSVADVLTLLNTGGLDVGRLSRPVQRLLALCDGVQSRLLVELANDSASGGSDVDTEEPPALVDDEEPGDEERAKKLVATTMHMLRPKRVSSSKHAPRDENKQARRQRAAEKTPRGAKGRGAKRVCVEPPNANETEKRRCLLGEETTHNTNDETPAPTVVLPTIMETTPRPEAPPSPLPTIMETSPVHESPTSPPPMEEEESSNVETTLGSLSLSVDSTASSTTTPPAPPATTTAAVPMATRSSTAAAAPAAAAVAAPMAAAAATTTTTTLMMAPSKAVPTTMTAAAAAFTGTASFGAAMVELEDDSTNVEDDDDDDSLSVLTNNIHFVKLGSASCGAEEYGGLGRFSTIPLDLSLAIISRLNAAEMGRFECTCRAARGSPGFIELAVTSIKRRHYGVRRLPILARETWPRMLQRWEWTRSSRSLSTRMDGVAAALDSLALDRSLGLIQ